MNSLAINSSIIKLFAAIFSADPFRSFPASSGYSSLNPRIADGSIPIRGSSSLIIPDKTLIFFLIVFCALLTSPFERNVLALTSWSAVTTL